MNCLHEDSLLSLVEGEATENQSRAWREHLVACDACRGRLDQVSNLIGLVRNAHASVRASSQVQEILARLDAPRPRLFPRYALAATAACVVVASGSIAVLLRPTAPSFQMRGEEQIEAGAFSGRTLGCEVRSERGRLLNEHAVIARGEGLTFRVSNRSRNPVEFALLGIDANRNVHWLEPEPGAPMRTIPVGVHDLPEGVVPDAPALGAMQIIAVFSREKIDIGVIEGWALRDELERALPQAVVQRFVVDVQEKKEL